MLCFGFIAITNDFYKNIKSMYSTMLSNAYRRTKKWAWHLGVALDDFANVRKFSGSAPAQQVAIVNSLLFSKITNLEEKPGEEQIIIT